jgi:uncharacterized spore protein YtfJ
MQEKDKNNATIDEFQSSLSAMNIVGEPIELEDKIIIPITKMGIGFGTRFCQGENDNKTKGFAGSGGGMGIFPVAVVIVFKGVPGFEGVKVVPITASSSPANPVDDIADILIKKFKSYEQRMEKKHTDVSTIDVE